MVDSQLRARGICDERVLEAMLFVPREEFVPEVLQADAYGDWPQPIGAGQTISQPYTVAYMAQAAQLRGEEKVLEVGTGSGYGAAVLSVLVAEVHTIERLPALAHRACELLKKLDFGNVHVHIGDGSLGLPHEAPFDAIIVTAAGKCLPSAYVDQLTDGGRIVIPIGQQKSSQHLYRIYRKRGEVIADDLGRFAFVPLIGDQGWESP
ncbi:MAG: protein-L-isoaspartate(D-aspartate) O-methyltransferase [Planctomycetaceae bacterium]|nr:protein-L-isoaspartate(D-aspartate) O-methyltransferase [Planctomycetaceae bacterium]